MTKVNLTKTLFGSAMAIMLAAGPSLAQDNSDINAWNTDSSSGISDQEFATGFRDNVGVFETWDADSDGKLSESEFQAGFDGLDESEARYDVDLDFASWDGDNDDQLEEQEFHESVFNAYDADSNNVIEEPEFGDLGDDIGDGGFWDI